MKSIRQAIILEIIGSKDIETQSDLANELNKHGMQVTQATVSRDIKEMKLVKVLNEKGGYKYAAVDHSEKGVSDRLIRIFSESVLSITAAENIIVIKTLTGSANAAAETVDSLHWNEIVGTLAGDNTIFVVIQSKESVPDVIAGFQSLLRQ